MLQLDPFSSKPELLMFTVPVQWFIAENSYFTGAQRQQNAIWVICRKCVFREEGAHEKMLLIGLYYFFNRVKCKRNICVLVHAFHFNYYLRLVKKFLRICLFKSQSYRDEKKQRGLGERERERERILICWFAPQMTEKALAHSSQSSEPGTPAGPSPGAGA